MRKLVSMVVGLLILATSSLALANNLTYLNGDRNFIMVDMHMGSIWYVDRSSLVVQQYEPPQYTIAVNVVEARSAIGDERDFLNGGEGAIVSVKTKRFFYNWDLRRMYVDRNGNSDWRYLDPNGCWAATGISMPAGEIAFALAYNLKFYGGKKFYNSLLRRMMCPYDDAFYSGI